MASDVLRTAISQQQQPTMLRQATVAIEDRRFYQHGGVDYEGLMRAAIKDVFEGGGIQGGSTLTMQLVTNVYLPTNIERPAQPQVQDRSGEARQRTRVDSTPRTGSSPSTSMTCRTGRCTGRPRSGSRQPREMFFDKPVQELDLAQFALLAGLPQAPSEYNPFEHPALARWRRGLVLQAMVKSGYISKAQAAVAQSKGLEVRHNDSYEDVEQPYVVDYVEQQLKQDLASRRVDQGGLKVYTTINLADQAAAKRRSRRTRVSTGDPASSLVSVDPSNGHILALQNSTTYGTGQGQTVFDYATQAQRQTGSAFKTFVLMTLIHDQDGDPNQTYYDSKYLAPGWLPGVPDLLGPHGRGRATRATISVTRATALSDNTVYAQLGVDLGMSNVDEIAHAMGITAQLSGNPSEAIGGLKYGVSPLQMADAYATLANGGDHVDADDHREGRLPSGKLVDTANPEKHDRSSSSGQAYAGTQTLETRAAVRHRHRRQLRLPGGRQDRHDQQLHRRLVRRLHAEALDGGLGRLSELRRVHERRQRPRPRLRRHARGADLAGVHAVRLRRLLRRFPAARRLLARHRVLRHARRLGLRAAGGHDHHAATTSTTSTTGGPQLRGRLECDAGASGATTAPSDQAGIPASTSTNLASDADAAVRERRQRLLT